MDLDNIEVLSSCIYEKSSCVGICRLSKSITSMLAAKLQLFCPLQEQNNETIHELSLDECSIILIFKLTNCLESWAMAIQSSNSIIV